MDLAGDIGGTKTQLALWEKGSCLQEKRYPSASFPDLVSMIAHFLNGQQVERACLGIAGPVKEGISQTTNLPWRIQASDLSSQLNIPQVILINDLEANAHGIAALKPQDLLTIQPGNASPGSHQAILSAGTGLGIAGLTFPGGTPHVIPSEGGHVEFAPRNAQEDALLLYLRKRFSHISYERVLSGPGLLNIYRFMIEDQEIPEDPAISRSILDEASPALISSHADHSAACQESLRLFTSLYGAAAGNVALQWLPFGGLFIGGGIAPKMTHLLNSETFLSAFSQKGRFSSLLKEIPLHIILNPHTALLGAAHYPYP
ncbi:MAG: glucokinase [Chlamydiota bacterium]|nr:glucokinase [Chlamydiota bacterium]